MEPSLVGTPALAAVCRLGVRPGHLASLVPPPPPACIWKRVPQGHGEVGAGDLRPVHDADDVEGQRDPWVDRASRPDSTSSLSRRLEVAKPVSSPPRPKGGSSLLPRSGTPLPAPPGVVHFSAIKVVYFSVVVDCKAPSP